MQSSFQKCSKWHPGPQNISKQPRAPLPKRQSRRNTSAIMHIERIPSRTTTLFSPLTIARDPTMVNLSISKFEVTIHGEGSGLIDRQVVPFTKINSGILRSRRTDFPPAPHALEIIFHFSPSCACFGRFGNLGFRRGESRFTLSELAPSFGTGPFLASGFLFANTSMSLM